MDSLDSKDQKTPESFYYEAEIQKYEIEDTIIALRVFGRGPAVVFIHGYPVHGYTWRKLLPLLSQHFTCYVVDLPGLGDSDWKSSTDFSFTAQARRLDLLFRSLKLKNFAIIAHNTGATLARLVSLLQPENVRKLAIINTEIPNHRPPWIRLYQFCAKLPFSGFGFRLLLRSSFFVRSSMAFKEFYHDSKLLLIPSNIDPYIHPIVTSSKRLYGMLNYLKGIEWSVVDEMSQRHKYIQSEVLFLWGETDKTFPVHLAEKMCAQFRSKCSFVRIANSSLMPHEENPDKILKHLFPFLQITFNEENRSDRTHRSIL